VQPETVHLERMEGEIQLHGEDSLERLISRVGEIVLRLDTTLDEAVGFPDRHLRRLALNGFRAGGGTPVEDHRVVVLVERRYLVLEIRNVAQQLPVPASELSRSVGRVKEVIHEAGSIPGIVSRRDRRVVVKRFPSAAEGIEIVPVA